jgi:hypothetical protein
VLPSTPPLDTFAATLEANTNRLDGPATELKVIDIVAVVIAGLAACESGTNSSHSTIVGSPSSGLVAVASTGSTNDVQGEPPLALHDSFAMAMNSPARAYVGATLTIVLLPSVPAEKWSKPTITGQQAVSLISQANRLDNLPHMGVRAVRPGTSQVDTYQEQPPSVGAANFNVRIVIRVIT